MINLSENRSALRVVIFLCFVINVSGSLFGGWDFLRELTDDLFSVDPIIEKTTSLITDIIFDLPSLEVEEEEENLITSEMVSECLKRGRELSRAASRRGNELVRSGVTLDAYAPGMLHFFSADLPSEIRKASDMSKEILSATKLLQMKMYAGITPNTFHSFLEEQGFCLRDPYCRPSLYTCLDASKYRSFDGTCNNEEHPEWGRRGAPFTRIATPRYADGIYAMPVARSGRALPNPRVLSTRLFADRSIGSRVLTNLNMQWGQFITHDMMFQLMEVTDEGGIQCCLGDGRDVLPAEWQNDKCIPITVPDDDPFYRKHGVKCLNFVRSITTPRDDCSLGHAEQMNTVTSYLDGSAIYGSDKKTCSKLRTRLGGRLRQEERSGSIRGFLPSVKDKAEVCDLRNSSEPCYLSGDPRINQTPTLAMLHTLFLREHNRIADKLSKLNPLWSDEKLFQEARKIVIAEIQHITYQEWLPTNFGEQYIRYYRISPSSLYSRDYSSDVNPGIINSFGAAAFRFLHSLISDNIVACPQSYDRAYLYKLSDYYFNPCLLESTPDSFDDIVRGIVASNAGESDPHCTAEITNLLFKSRNKWGMDLIAMDIQRGRDHGIASYNDFREICGLPRARTFQDLIGEMSQDRINALQYLYECVDDIDLFVGGALERDVQGSILGHTFQCIVAEQFYRSRIGDRFFYDHGEMPHSFTTDQLKEIKKASMARLICDNTDGVHFVQRKAFEVETPYNPKFHCDDYNNIPYVDLTAWKKSDLFD
ncbi:salivary peroxidase/catechol oxidase-like [Anticarsia gemmatalis]|uniref:salivary peroxidase/catechol oxidase-like n=1 Tax=Anticarsia gemmatalis TaxID=129554 RepID=UPI003F75AFF3